MTLLLLALFACVESAPSPDLGACASYPDGVYTYGQIGIGTCLSGPTALQFLDDGHVLAVSNANPFQDFTGGSLLTIDLDKIDESAGRNLVSDLDPHAVALPSFSGPMALDEAENVLLVTSRYSEGARTRESDDDVWFVDVSNPRTPSLNHDFGTRQDGAALPVGYDPNEIVYDDTTDRAWTINRTSHSVSTLDLASRPARLVPPGGDGRLEGDVFVDADGSGSKAAFARLQTLAETSTTVANHWDITWGAGVIRAWVSTDAGLYRTTGNGETTWVRSGIAYDVALEDAPEDTTTFRDPSWYLTDGEDGSFGVTEHLLFVDQGALRTAEDAGDGQHWAISDVILAPTEAEVALADPFMVRDDGGVNNLFYTAGSGHTWIGRASGSTREDFVAKDAVLSDDSAALSDASVLWDPEVSRWRMWYLATDDGGVSELRTAWSDDLRTWIVEPVAIPGVAAPTVGYWDGAFHLVESDGAGFVERLSADGYSWGAARAAFTPEAGSHVEDGVALFPTTESAFRLEDSVGEVFGYAIAPGDGYFRSDEGWSLVLASGHLAGPEDVELAGEDLRVTSRIGDEVWVDLGAPGIGHGTLIGGELTIDSVALAPSDDKAAFDHGAVESAVVVASSGGFTMFYAGSDGSVTRIGRATSADGLTWTRDAEANYAGGADWEALALSPGSVEVADDGSWTLWYGGAADEDSWKIGAISSTDEGATWAALPGKTYAWQFDAETPGTWDDSGVKDPFVVLDGDTERMWYSGFNGSVWQLGYAERTVGEATWTTSEDGEGTPRSVLESLGGAPGVDGVSRPVAVATSDGWELTYAAEDAGDDRVALAVAREPDRLHRALRFPTVADTWGFTVVPPNDGDAINLDIVAEGLPETGWGCDSLALDSTAGLLYVGCKLWPVVFAVDVRDDSTTTWADLNYLGVEAALLVQTSTGLDSGIRDILVNDDGTLFGLIDEPESVLVIKADDVVDDDKTDALRDRVRGLLPLPRSFERDAGVGTQSAVGPGQMALHPDGKHLFVTNFNNNSVSVFDLSLGPLGTLVAESGSLGENPYALTISPDGTRLWVANYEGEVDGNVSSTLVELDADPESPNFMAPLTWVVNK